MQHMKVILQKDVKGVGRTGDVLKVKRGFARNFLFPRQLALAATESKVKEWEHLQKVVAIKKQKKMTQYREVLERVSKTSLEFFVEASEKSGKIFGSITSVHIVEALEKEGIDLDRKDIQADGPIKTLGLHEVQVDLGSDLKTSLKLEVKAKKVTGKNKDANDESTKTGKDAGTDVDTDTDVGTDVGTDTDTDVDVGTN